MTSELSKNLDLSFDDCKKKYFRVEIGEDKFVAYEASERTACDYQNMVMGSIRMKDGKTSGMQGLANAEPFLVSRCLKLITVEGKELPVSEKTINDWPARIVDPIYQNIKEISGLNQEASPLEKALKSFLKSNHTEMTLERMIEEVNNAVEENEELYEPLQTLLKPDGEEEAKND